MLSEFYIQWRSVWFMKEGVGWGGVENVGPIKAIGGVDVLVVDYSINTVLSELARYSDSICFACVLLFAALPGTERPILVPPFWAGRHQPLKDYITEIVNFENLRDITFKLWHIPTETDLKALWKIPSLTCIKLIFNKTMQWRRETEYSVSEWQAQMEQLTHEFAIGEKKRLVLLFEPYSK
ncbi:hypothetical protein BDN70DRAFT_892601 [Pholiota conissans]|uniref:Uncharacterized protein n=1 Tax=Pholiota conissans TaxID=109636 RepID=A0A9P5ZAF0_9AGAR|nr:hypothetical protein BDN70DRAFT_892601 [Pholiota conissans]